MKDKIEAMHNVIEDNIDEFDRVWQETLRPLIVLYSKKYKIKKKPINYVERRLRSCFLFQRDLFLKSFMKDDVYNIDRHKIAACLMKSILTVRPLYIPLKTKIKFALSKKTLTESLGFSVDQLVSGINNKIYYANEYLALSVAINVIEAYILADKGKECKHKIIVPDPFSSEDHDYLLDVCIDLNAHHLREINIVTFANVFFLLEKYSCRRTQCENLQNECRRLLLKYGECCEDEVDKMVQKITLGQV